MENHHGRRSMKLDDTACTFDLETTFDDNMGSYGNMFDIKTLGGEISIYAMDIYVDVKSSVNYEIYTKPNSFKEDDGKRSLKPWTLVKKGTVFGGGRQVGTHIRDFTIGNLSMAPNEMRAFYVTLDTTDLRYRNITEDMPNAVTGDLYIDNDDLELYVGVSVAGFPLKEDTMLFGKRVWSGRFFYFADRTCAPSATPTIEELPSRSPSGSLESSSPSALVSTTPSVSIEDTIEPSISTSEIPTIAVSSRPSLIKDSLTPSEAFSLDPTVMLSQEPSAIDATLEPTMIPTSAHSTDPTRTPSFLESSMPSTPFPTLLPSSPSTLTATSIPSSYPTTSVPTFEPSLSPSTSTPTFLPSSSPSTLLPTSLPSQKKSLSPSMFPPTSIPTTAVSATPSRTEPEHWRCAKTDALQTTLDGSTGAFGSMFTVTAKSEPVRITTLSLHTDFETSNITAMVYTKLGDFVGFENEPRAWRKISESTFRGAGRGFLSRIPVEDFEPLYLFANDTVALYVTLKTADLRYSRTNISLGSAIASDDFIEIGSGVGVADYPFASEFFLYSPRAFNGAVHFSSKSDCQPTMNISYSFNVHHPNDVVGTDLNRLIENNVEMTARSLIVERPILASFATEHNVNVGTAWSTQLKGSCRPLETKFLCTPVDASVCVKYSETLREGELRFEWLKAYTNVSDSVNLMFTSEYVGDIPVENPRIISLKTREVPTPMTNATQRAFEMTVMRYLSKQLIKKNITILDVKITGQNIRNFNDVHSARALQRDNDDQVENRPGSTLDVSTNINGQYRPPPDIDYSSSVEDAMDADPQDMEQSLKRSDRYFEIVESTSSEKDKSVDSPKEERPTPEGASSSNTLLIVFICVIVVFFVFVCGTWYWRRRQRKRRKFAGQSFVQDSKVLQEKKSFWGRIAKSKKSFRDTFATADAIWDESVPVVDSSSSKTASYNVQYSDHDHYTGSRYYDDPDRHVAEQFQEIGTYGYSSQYNPEWGPDHYRSELSNPNEGFEPGRDSFPPKS